MSAAPWADRADFLCWWLPGDVGLRRLERCVGSRTVLTADRAGADGMVPSPDSAHRRRLPLLLGLLLTTTSTASAAVSDVYQLPSETFTLLAPSWLWKGHGFVNDSDAVFWTGATGSLCK